MESNCTLLTFACEADFAAEVARTRGCSCRAGGRLLLKSGTDLRGGDVSLFHRWHLILFDLLEGGLLLCVLVARQSPSLLAVAVCVLAVGDFGASVAAVELGEQSEDLGI